MQDGKVTKPFELPAIHGRNQVALQTELYKAIHSLEALEARYFVPIGFEFMQVS